MLTLVEGEGESKVPVVSVLHWCPVLIIWGPWGASKTLASLITAWATSVGTFETT